MSLTLNSPTSANAPSRSVISHLNFLFCESTHFSVTPFNYNALESRNQVYCQGEKDTEGDPI